MTGAPLRAASRLPVRRLVRRAGLALVAALVAVPVALTLAQRLGSAGPWWLEMSRYLPWPLLLAPPAIAFCLVPLLGLARRWCFAAAAAVLLQATLGMGWVWHSAPRDGAVAPAGALRVMTYNVKSGSAFERPGGIDALQSEIARQRPDVLVMQDAHGLLRLRPGGPTAPLFGYDKLFGYGQYVIASRYDLRDCTGSWVPVPDGEPFTFARCLVDAPGRVWPIATLHLESPRMGLVAARREGADGIGTWRRNVELRLAQARAVAAALGPRDAPFVLAGDFNAVQTSAVMKTFESIGLVDAFAAAGRGYGYTYGHTLRPAFSFLRIDHILAGPGIDIVDCAAGGDAASDHRPVVADLRIRPPA